MMKVHRTTLEKIASTVEEAIAIGLEDLGLEREAVEIEVLDEGNRGLFGLGTRMARVRLTVKDIPVVEEEWAEAEEEAVISEALGEVESEEFSEEDDSYELFIAQKVINELLDKMGVKARVSAKFGEPDEGRTRIPILVDLSGSDLGILIGKKAETLNALQYIAGLIIGKQLERSVMLVIDVEGYRQRRLMQVRQMARNMAEQAVVTGRKQILEPMSAAERRIVHMELREDPRITTESTGEDPHRKVNIIPVKE
jgi:spoIIIJ-associated protein